MTAADSFSFAFASDVGRRRSENQDAVSAEVRGDAALFVVADGMGGVEGGALAAQTVVQVFRETVWRSQDWSPEVLQAAVQTANARVFELAAERNLSGMGSTLVALALQAGRAQIVAVGDSRAYRLRRGELEQLSTDHTVLAELRAAAKLKPTEGEASPVAHMLTRSMGPKPEVLADCLTFELRPGDRVLLCSDGLYNMLADAKLAAIISALPVERAVKELVEQANAAGGHDNISALVVEVRMLRAGLPGPNSVLKNAAEIFCYAVLLVAALFADRWWPGLLSSQIRRATEIGSDLPVLQPPAEIAPELSEPPEGENRSATKTAAPAPAPEFLDKLREKLTLADTIFPAPARERQLEELLREALPRCAPQIELCRELGRYLKLLSEARLARLHWRKHDRDTAAGERVGQLARELSVQRELILQLLAHD